MQRVVVAGLGDSGLLTAIKLARDFDVVGISSKPGLVSGQELGVRVSRPADWARDYWIAFDRYRALDRVRTVHGTLTGVDLDARTVAVDVGGESATEPYDALVISTGVSNGFWRRPHLQTAAQVGADLQAAHARFAEASSIAVIGGGAATLAYYTVRSGGVALARLGVVEEKLAALEGDLAAIQAGQADIHAAMRAAEVELGMVEEQAAEAVAKAGAARAAAAGAVMPRDVNAMVAALDLRVANVAQALGALVPGHQLRFRQIPARCHANPHYF